MRKRGLILILVLLLFSYAVEAATLSGLVKDEKGEGLPRATIRVEGSSKGVVADNNGRYSLTLDAGSYTIAASYVGYEKQSKQITLNQNAQQKLDFVLKQTAIQLPGQTVEAERPALPRVGLPGATPSPLTPPSTLPFKGGSFVDSGYYAGLVEKAKAAAFTSAGITAAKGKAELSKQQGKACSSHSECGSGICYGGMCRPKPKDALCIESDVGLAAEKDNPKVKAGIIINAIPQYDACLCEYPAGTFTENCEQLGKEFTHVRETTCSEQQGKVVACENGCKDGACIRVQSCDIQTRIRAGKPIGGLGKTGEQCVPACKDDFILVTGGKEKDCWDERSQCVNDKCVKFEDMGWDEQTTAQVGKLKANYGDVRESGARALGELKAVNGLPVLIKVLETDDNPEVRKAVINSLYRDLKSEKSIPALIKVLEGDKYAEVRRFAVIGLGALKAKQAIPVLIKVLETDDDHYVRTEAIFSLYYDLESEKSIPAFIKVLQYDKFEEVRNTVSIALKNIDTPEVNSAFLYVVEKDESYTLAQSAARYLIAHKKYEELGRALANRINSKSVYIYNVGDNEVRQLAVLINYAHDLENSPEDRTRNTIVQNLNLNSVYILLSLGGSDLYTSTFEKIYYYNLMQGAGYPSPRYPDFMNKISEDIDKEQVYTFQFILTLANYNRLKDIISLNPGFFMDAIKSALLEEEGGRLRRNGVLLTSTFQSIFNDVPLSQFKPEIEEFLLENYRKSNDRSIEKAIFGYHISINKEQFSSKNKAEALAISNSLANLGLLEPYVPKNWLADGKLTAKLYFTQKGQMSRTEENFKKYFEFDEIINKDNSVLMIVKPDSTLTDGRSNGRFNGIKLEVVLTEDLKDVKDSVESPTIDIISHRGHSYSELNVFSPDVVSDKKKLIFLGGCGGFGRIAIIQKTLPNAYFISDENIGQGDVNDRVLFYVMRSIAKRNNQNKILWGEVEQDVKDSYKKINAEFGLGIIFPHDKSLLLNPFINHVIAGQ